MPDFTQLHTLVLASELGSLAAVARRQGISAAAVSKQLTRLENELGVQLLVRTTRHLALTEIGTDYCAQCRRILEELDMAATLVSQDKAVPHGILKVVSGRHFAAAYITPHLKEFLTAYPQIKLHLELAERIPDLHKEGVDILLGMSLSAPNDTIQKRIATTRYAYCASPAYLKKFGVPIKPEDLKNHRYITHSMRQPDNELRFGNKLILVLPYCHINDTHTMLNLALDGLGIVKLHKYVVQDALQSGALQEVLTSYTKEDIPIYVAYIQRRFVPSKVRCFIDFVEQKCALHRHK